MGEKSIFMQIGSLISDSINQTRSQLQIQIDEEKTARTNALDSLQMNIMDLGVSTLSDSYTKSEIDVKFDNIDLSNLKTNLVPIQSNTIDLGTSLKRFNNLYVDDIYLGKVSTLSTNASNDAIFLKPSTNNSLVLETTGLGTTSILSQRDMLISTDGTEADIILETLGTNSKIIFKSSNGVDFNTPLNANQGLYVTGDTVIDGDLIVTGTQTVVNRNDVSTSSNMLYLNQGEVGSGVTAGTSGIQIDRGTAPDYQLIYNENVDKFVVGSVGGPYETLATQEYVLSNIVSKLQQTYNHSTVIDPYYVHTDNNFTTAEKNKLANLSNYTLPIASRTVLGGVKAGNNITIDSNGVISANDISVPWSDIISKPTTIYGYNITDAYTKSQIDAALASKVNYSNISNVARTGSYADLTHTPVNLSYFVNDAGYQTASQVQLQVENIIGFAPDVVDTLQNLSTQLANETSAINALNNLIATKADSTVPTLVSMPASFNIAETSPTQPWSSNSATGNLIDGINPPALMANDPSAYLEIDIYDITEISSTHPLKVYIYEKNNNYVGLAAELNGVPRSIFTTKFINGKNYYIVTFTQGMNGIPVVLKLINQLKLYNYYIEDVILEYYTGSDVTSTLSTLSSDILNKVDKSTTLSGYGITDAQPTLVSGSNIKTINGMSILGSGDIITIPTTITGNAGTATKLFTPRTIAGVAFDGTSNINIPFPALTSKPTTLAGYGITDVYTKTQTDTGIANEATIRANADSILQGNIDALANALTSSNGSIQSTTDTLMSKADLSGAIFSGPVSGTTFTGTNFVGNLVGNAGTATKLIVPRTIAGVLFDGTSNITIPFSGLSSLPTTLAGYGITDVYTKLATDSAISNAVAGVLNSAPAALDTLKELAAALGNDANYATTVANALATKAGLSGATFTGPIAGTTFTGTTFNGTLNGNAGTASKLATPITVTINGGDMSGTVTGFDGSSGLTIPLTLSSTGVTPGTYTKIIVDSKGRITSGSALTSADLPSIDAANITSGTIDATRLPTYVYNYGSYAALPATGTVGRIYIVGDTNKLYRWNGTGYTQLTPINASDIPSLDAAKITSGTIDSARLPNYIQAYATYANLPTIGEVGRIYVANDTNKLYRWNGTGYTPITSGGVDSVAGKTGAVSLAKGDVGLANVDNTADATKQVASAGKLTTPMTLNTTGEVLGSSPAFDGSSNVSMPLSLSTTGVTPGTYKSVTVDSKGRVTAGTNPSTLAGFGINDAYNKVEMGDFLSKIYSKMNDLAGIDVRAVGYLQGGYKDSTPVSVIQQYNTLTQSTANLADSGVATSYIPGFSAKDWGYYSYLSAAVYAFKKFVYTTRVSSAIGATTSYKPSVSFFNSGLSDKIYTSNGSGTYAKMSTSTEAWAQTLTGQLSTGSGGARQQLNNKVAGFVFGDGTAIHNYTFSNDTMSNTGYTLTSNQYTAGLNNKEGTKGYIIGITPSKNTKISYTDAAVLSSTTVNVFTYNFGETHCLTGDADGYAMAGYNDTSGKYGGTQHGLCQKFSWVTEATTTLPDLIQPQSSGEMMQGY